MNASGLRAAARTWQRWISTATSTSLRMASSSAEWVVPGRGREKEVAVGGPGTSRTERTPWAARTPRTPRTPRTHRERISSTAMVGELLPHEDPVFLSKLETRQRSATPELARLRAYTLANRGEYDLATLSTLYAAAGMLKYASATMDRIYADDSVPRPTASQWVELLEAGRRDRDPVFAKEMVEAMRHRAGRIPSKRMQLVLLNTYAESGMAREALQVYEEIAARHDADLSMAIALLKACIRQRDLPESFVDMVVDVVGRGGRPIPRRVMSMVLMAYASRETNTVERCFELAEALEALGPLRPRDLLALLRACREAGDVERADRVLEMIHQCGRAQVGASGQDGWGGEALGEAFDVSLATEVCRAHLLAGRTEDAKAVFEEIPFDSRDLALYNVLVESLDPSTASRVFDEAWQRGLFGRRRRKLTANRRVVHIDLHRLGLRMAELAMDKHLQELQSPGRGDVAGSVKAVKVIVGKGKPNPGKTRLCEHVRGLLYDRGIANRETWPGVFTIQLHDW